MTHVKAVEVFADTSRHDEAMLFDAAKVILRAERNDPVTRAAAHFVETLRRSRWQAENAS